jgi:ribosomal protein S27E
MVELRRSIKCSNCGTETTLYLSSEMALSELLVHGRCQKCGNSLQLNFNIVDSSGQSAKTDSAQSQSQGAEAPAVNLDETLFNEPADIPSETIRDLIES